MMRAVHSLAGSGTWRETGCQFARGRGRAGTGLDGGFRLCPTKKPRPGLALRQ